MATAIVTSTHPPVKHELMDRPYAPPPLAGGRNVMLVEQLGETCPVTFCSVCGRQIRDVGLGGVVWQRTRSGRATWRVLCKDRGTGEAGSHGCLSQLPDRHLSWMGLDEFFALALYNLGVRSSQAWERIWDLQQLDLVV